MGKVYSVGFKEEEHSKIGEIVSKKGLEFVELTEDVVETLSAAERHTPVFIKVDDREGVKLLKKIKTEAGENIYVCGVDYSNRDIAFAVSLIDDVRVFYLPVDENEIRKVLNEIMEEIRVGEAETSVFDGLKSSFSSFEWETDKVAVSSVCKYLARSMRNAGFYKTSTEEDNAVLALEEALLNSIEHGNLELDSSLRPKDILEEDKYELLKAERLRDKRYAGRKIKIGVEMDENKCTISIEDEGQGFDTSKVKDYINNENYTNEDIADVSGKGFSLMKRAFDKVEYNDRGTVIKLTKYRDKS